MTRRKLNKHWIFELLTHELVQYVLLQFCVGCSVRIIYKIRHMSGISWQQAHKNGCAAVEWLK